MDAADYNYVHSVTVFAGYGKTGEAVQTLDFAIGNTRGRVSQFNSAYFKRPTYKLERAVDRVLAYYDRAAVPFRAYVRSTETAARALLAERGLVEQAALPVMVLPGAECSAPEIPGLRIRRVGDADGVAPLSDFQRLSFESFGFPPELGPVGMTPELAALPEVEQFVGYLEGEPVACSMLLCTGTMAGIYWVGTLERCRRRGLGAALTAHAVAAGRARGCTDACLQASTMGAPVYRVLGFDHPYDYAVLERTLDL